MANLVRVWPETYKIVLVLTVLLLASSAAFHMFVLDPLVEQHEAALEEYETEGGKVKASEWDSSESGIANATKLYTLAIGTKRDRGARDASDALLTASTGHLGKLIEQVKRRSKNDYIGTEGKKTYSDKYDEIKKRFREYGKGDASLGIELIPSVFGMGRASEGNYYHMTLKLLLTADVVELLQKHHLRVLRTRELYLPETDQIFIDVRDREAMRKVPASELTANAVRRYAIKPGEEPYLLEVSLKAKVTGSMKDFAAFAADLHGEGRHYSMTNLELQTVKPVMRNARRGESQLIPSQENAREVRIDGIVGAFTCSGFALPETDLSKVAVSKPGNRPRKRTKRVKETVSEKPLGI